MTKMVKADGSPTEDAIHVAVINHLKRHRKLNKRAIHIANEGHRDFRYAVKLKRMGVTSGVYDVHIAKAERGYHGMWLELKSKGGKLSKEQLQFKEEYEAEGYFCCEAYSIDEALQFIQWYLDES